MSNDLSMQNSAVSYSVGMSEVEARQLGEIRGKMVLAKQFPRDPQLALKRILTECENLKLAENATYSFKRGDSEVRGASIRLAEVIGTYWGNFTSGVTELEQRNGESTVKAYAWDLESNFSDEKVFTVRHERSTKKGNYKITDPRDVYELVANQGARRKRSCIFAVIPAYIVDMAVEACQETLEAGINKEGAEKSREKMLSAFTVMDNRITKEALEEKIGKEFDKFNAKDIVKLRNLYSAIKDGFVKVNDAFDFNAAADGFEIPDDDGQRKAALAKALMGDTPPDILPDTPPAPETSAADVDFTGTPFDPNSQEAEGMGDE